MDGDGDSEIMVEEMAKTLETILTDMTSIDFRVPRKYIELGKNGRVVGIFYRRYRFRKGTGEVKMKVKEVIYFVRT